MTFLCIRFLPCTGAVAHGPLPNRSLACTRTALWLPLPVTAPVSDRSCRAGAALTQALMTCWWRCLWAAETAACSIGSGPTATGAPAHAVVAAVMATPTAAATMVAVLLSCWPAAAMVPANRLARVVQPLPALPAPQRPKLPALPHTLPPCPASLPCLPALPYLPSSLPLPHTPPPCLRSQGGQRGPIPACARPRPGHRRPRHDPAQRSGRRAAAPL